MCGRPPIEHSLEQARACLERIAWREVEGGPGGRVDAGRTFANPLAQAEKILSATKRVGQ
jgi:hypothetical protein